ncbi:Uncharacterised protein, partial [Mycoplasmopsis synoviae]
MALSNTVVAVKAKIVTIDVKNIDVPNENNFQKLLKISDALNLVVIFLLLNKLLNILW